MRNKGLIAFGFQEKPLSEIMVLGVGGAGCNAVKRMHATGAANVTLALCNTDRQSLDYPGIPVRIQLGEGLGAGNNPEKAAKAAHESLDEITATFRREGTRMLFLAAGMGGGTGTGASAVIARAAKTMGILTVSIVSLPLMDEGPRRVEQARRGLEELQRHTDSLVIVRNDNIPAVYGEMPFDEALSKADEILASAATSIAELVTRHDRINVDLEDVRTVMLDSGLSLMGSARAGGPDRIERLIEQTLHSPLLSHKGIGGAHKVLYTLCYGPDSVVTMSEAARLLNLIQRSASNAADRSLSDIIWGAGVRDDLGDQVELTVIATGFDAPATSSASQPGKEPDTAPGESGPQGNDEGPQEPVDGNSSIIESLIRRGGKFIDRIFDASDTEF